MQTVKFTHFYDAPTDTKRVSFGGSSGIGKEARRTDLQGKSRGRRSPPGWNGNHRHVEPEARG